MLTRKYNKSNLIYDSKYTFNRYRDIKKFDSLSFKSKYSHLKKFFVGLKRLNTLQRKHESNKNKCAWWSFTEPCEIYLDENEGFSDSEKIKIDAEQNPKKLKLIPHQYEGWLTEHKDGEPVDLPLIPPL